MKILFSPSEAKNSTNNEKSFNENSFIFKHLFKYRIEVFNKYRDFIKDSDNDSLTKLFGTKKQDTIDYYKKVQTKGGKVILRYSGVAFKYLDYQNLTHQQQDFIDENVLIFSNLFGVMLAGDKSLPDYKLKQGAKIEGFNIEKFYNDKFSSSLDKYLENELILDLRAGFYEKFYKIKKPYITMKFKKDGKIVSHYSKAYRGLILKQLSKTNITNIDDLLKIKFDNLVMTNQTNIKNKTEITYELT